MSSVYPSNFRQKMATGKAVLGTGMPAPMTRWRRYSSSWFETVLTVAYKLVFLSRWPRCCPAWSSSWRWAP